MVLLRKLRNEKGLSTNELARRTNVSRYVISNIENKQYKAATTSMQKLADYFGVKEPLELTEIVYDVTQEKKCLNQRCPLNRECYCQSEQVIEGAQCNNQNLVTEKAKKIVFDNISLSFAEI